MTTSVAVTGFGILTACGFGAENLERRLHEAAPAFRPVTRFDTDPYRVKVAATGPEPVPTLADAALTCARDAVRMAGATAAPDAVLFGTQGDWTFLNRFSRNASTAGLGWTAPHAVAGHLARELGGPEARALTFVNGCTAAAGAIAYGAHLLRLGRSRLVLAGGGYLVDEEFFAKFDAGRALASDGLLRAFSLGRQGLLLGDGVAVLALEPLDEAKRRGGEPLAVLRGWGAAGDAHHVCRPHPDGRGMVGAVRQALRRGSTTAAAVGYVNAHGTGTPLNDAAETRALHEVFGVDAASIPVSSTKTITGHTLEGSAAVEAVISLLALRSQTLPPTASYVTGDEECDLDYVPDGPREARFDAVLSVNAAFGGANSALVFSRVP